MPKKYCILAWNSRIWRKPYSREREGNEVCHYHLVIRCGNNECNEDPTTRDLQACEHLLPAWPVGWLPSLLSDPVHQGMTSHCQPNGTDQQDQAILQGALPSAGPGSSLKIKQDSLVEAQRNGGRQESTGENEKKEQEKWDAAYLLPTLFSVVPMKKTKAKIFWGQPLLKIQEFNVYCGL